MGVYSNDLKDLASLPNGSKETIPNDPTNGSRALELLAKNGIIKLADKELVTKVDITENPKKYRSNRYECRTVTNSFSRCRYSSYKL